LKNYLPVKGVEFILDHPQRGKTECPSLCEVLAEVRTQATQGMHVQRYKGLGEMNPSQLWESAMDPQDRSLIQVTLEDAVEADSIFTILMGDHAAPRREFIQAHAHEVKNLDI